MSLVTREMPISVTVRCYLPHTRTAQVTVTSCVKSWRGLGGAEALQICCWEGKLVEALWRTVWQFCRNVNTQLPLAIPLLHNDFP